ncbi:MAG: UvrB/UvrC motif-containing protein [Isosphaeraceae bacterium]
MTCHRCKEEASVHLTETVNGRRKEVHLCASCARQAGVLPTEASPPELPLDKVVQSLIVTHVGELVGELAGLTCPVCGLKFMEYRARGRLGCPNDYNVFSRGLLPLLNRAHGATRHVGKMARSQPEAAERLKLRAQLRNAVARENYEEAARLRDLLRLKDADA